MEANKDVSAARPRPVLMTPVRRCGSHALRLRLNANTDFYAPYPLHIVDFMPLVELYGDLEDDDTYFQLIIDVIGLQNASMVKWDGLAFDPVLIFDTIKDRRHSIHSIIWEMLFEAGRAHGAKVVMDKSLDSVHYADDFIDLFDDMLFLNVVRDPRAQVNSMNWAIIHEFDTLLNTQIWVRAHEAAHHLMERHPERVLTIRFEDFLEDQETVLRKICQFLGLNYKHCMTDISSSLEAEKISQLSNLWESNASHPIPANIDKFKKTLSQHDIEIIESLAGPFMDYYGYERMTDSNIKIDEDAINDAVKCSAEIKLEAWQALRHGDSRDYQLRRFRVDYIGMVRERLLAELPMITVEPHGRSNAANVAVSYQHNNRPDERLAD